jgi:hypothetical protein
MAQPQIKRCREPFATEVDGITRVIAVGTLVATDDPVYTRSTAAHFEDIEAHVTARADRLAAAGKGAKAEQATADPGEARSVTPPSPATAAFDPGEHSVKDVLAYLDGADEDEAARVVAAETAGKARAGILARGQ